MKKRENRHNFETLCAAFLCAGVFFAGAFSAPVPAPVSAGAETSRIMETSIGYSVNALKDGNGGPQHYIPILDADFLAGNNEILTRMNVRSSYGFTAPRETYAQLALSAAWGWDRGRGEEYFFLSDINSKIGSVLEEAKDTPFIGQYYYQYSICSVFYSLSLNNAYVSDAYADKLAGGFLMALERLSQGELTYPGFFDVYGTHMIAGVKYGLRFDAYYAVLSKEISFGAGDVQDSINVAVDNLCNPDAGIDLELPDSGKVNKNNSVAVSCIKGYGGDINEAALFLGQRRGRLREWLESSTEENAHEIGYSGLVPLYEMLPQKYSALYDPMKKAFEEYVVANTNLYEDSFASDSPVDPPDVSGEDTLQPKKDDGKILKIALIGGSCVIVAAAGICVACYCVRKKVKKGRKK